MNKFLACAALGLALAVTEISGEPCASITKGSKCRKALCNWDFKTGAKWKSCSDFVLEDESDAVEDATVVIVSGCSKFDKKKKCQRKGCDWTKGVSGGKRYKSCNDPAPATPVIVSTLAPTTLPVEPTAPCSDLNSVLAGPSRFTWETMRGCCREDYKTEPHDSAIIWYLDGMAQDAAVANCSAACAMNAQCTAYEVSRKKKLGQFKCENHVETINTASRKSKSCKKALCSAKTGCTRALQITSFSVPCLGAPCEQIDTRVNEISVCSQAIASVAGQQSKPTTEYTCSMTCSDEATCDVERARRTPQTDSADVTALVFRSAEQDATNGNQKDEEVAKAITIDFVVTDPATNATITLTQETEAPELKEIYSNDEDTTIEDLVGKFEEAPTCGDDLCCNDNLCVTTFGSESDCCKDKFLCRSADSCVDPASVTTLEPGRVRRFERSFEDECTSGHDSRAGATSEVQCLALSDCTYNAHCDHCYNSERVFYLGCEEEQSDNGYAFKCGGCNQAICAKLCEESPDDCGGDEYNELCKRYDDECTPLVGDLDSYCEHLPTQQITI